MTLEQSEGLRSKPGALGESRGAVSTSWVVEDMNMGDDGRGFAAAACCRPCLNLELLVELEAVAVVAGVAVVLLSQGDAVVVVVVVRYNDEATEGERETCREEDEVAALADLCLFNRALVLLPAP